MSYSISISAGAMMAASCLGAERRQVDLGRAPSLVPESAARGRFGRHVADELDRRWDRCDGRLGESALHAIDHRLQGDVARDRIAALVVEFAHRRADLVVGVGGDILHQEIDQARIALHDAENLQGAVGGPRRGSAGAEAGAALAALRRRRGRAAARQPEFAQGGLGELPRETGWRRNSGTLERIRLTTWLQDF